MKSPKCGLMVAFAIFHSTIAHYCFPYLMANETIFPKWKYVRPSITNDTASLVGGGSFPPMYDLSSENIRCGRNSTGSGSESDVAVIKTGSKVGFRPDLYPRSYCCGQHQIPYFHDGPLFAYLSRSPDQSKTGLQAWDGDGDWFKIAERGPPDDIGWWYTTLTNNTNLYTTWNLTIPEATPPGFYLLRVESIFPKNDFNRTQFYASCAQVEIIGEGDSDVTPGPTVRFPGAFDNYEPGIWLRENMTHRWTSYKMPGPKVWTGE